MNWCNVSSKPTREMAVRVDVQFAIEDESIPAADEIALWIGRAFEAAGDSANADVSVRVVGVDEMRDLNKEFREQDKSTNVLSFPAGDIAGLPSDAERPLGDIVVCAGVVSDEADRQHKSLHDHWAHMLIHGTLHLLGFDHVCEAEAVEMEGLEVRILTEHGIANPYAESLQQN